MNIYAIFIPPEESGISVVAINPSETDYIKETALRKTAFNIHVRNGFRRHYLDERGSRAEQIIKVANTYISFTDSIILLVNTPEDQGDTGIGDFSRHLATVSVRDNFESIRSKYLLWHEYAHALSGLEDEYVGFSTEGFNKSMEMDPEKFRWKDLIPEGVDILRPHPNNPLLAIPTELCRWILLAMSLFAQFANIAY